ncbi:MAG: hypothetical protein C4582_07925 [Desulfobacteraceae bacterium]|nr:MAG: hypothetical protein C4582_07925 [Desulfobacteraceae bacterium]
MDRRTFIKAAILAAPALCLPQILSGKGFERRIKEADESPDFVIFFIGGYGRAVSESFRVLRERNPVIRKCGHIGMDVSSDRSLVLVTNFDEAASVLSMVERLKMGIFVVDMRDPGDFAIAEGIAKEVRGKGERLIAMTPGEALSASRMLLDCVFETALSGKDLCPSFLLTLHNTFLGCGGMGSIMCLKYFLDYFLVMRKHRFGRVLISAEKEWGGDELAVRSVLSDAMGSVVQDRTLEDDAPVWAILETHHEDKDPVKHHEEISHMLEAAFPGFSGCLVHPGLSEPKMKLTIIEFL